MPKVAFMAVDLPAPLGPTITAIFSQWCLGRAIHRNQPCKMSTGP
jgi:hypothetical protein